MDGGRLVAKLTLEALSREGHTLTLVTPANRETTPAELRGALPELSHVEVVATKPKGRLATVLRAAITGRPYSLLRHHHPRVGRRVELLLKSKPFDAVHVEQLHALGGLNRIRGGPVVLRAQNVESDLWLKLAGISTGVRAAWIGSQARRLARWEGKLLVPPAAVVALTSADAARLRTLSRGQASVHCVPAPFPRTLPPAAEPLAGDPALVLFGSPGWVPNSDAVSWFLAQTWPAVRRRLPGVHLHIYGKGEPGARVTWHPPAERSHEVFAPNAILVLPLRIASGIRMRILEAWARGIPVVATPEAAGGLDIADRRELLIAERPEEFGRAIADLHDHPDLRQRLRTGGQLYLDRHHSPTRVAQGLTDIYLAATRSARPLRQRD